MAQYRHTLAALLLCALTGTAAAAFLQGDVVRLTRSETLMFNGKNFLGAPKGQEFRVLKHDAARGQVFVAFYKDDGTLIAVSLPAEALETSPPDPWMDLLCGVEAFRDQRYEQSRRLLARAAQNAEYRVVAGTIAARTTGAANAVVLAKANTPQGMQAFANTLQALRDVALQTANNGQLCIAVALDEGADRLAAQMAGIQTAPTRIAREDLSKRVAISNRSVARSRQAIAVHRMMEASKCIEEGLAAEPARPELKAMEARVEKEIKNAEESYEAANRMKRFEKGAIHALTALDRGLKYCADHPKLLALKQEMSSLFEERTSPRITAALLKTTGKEGSAAALEEGRSLYVNRCTECHELELLDSRTVSAWRDAVASMSRRANLDGGQQARIIEYLMVAQRGMDAVE
jgi:hypothetical protein